MQLLNMEKQITSLLLANNLPIFDPFCLWVSAERAGFEPAKPFRGLHAFQACLFNHSSISPIIRLASSKTTAKYEKIPICNLFSAQIYSFCLTYTQYPRNKF